MLATAIMIVIVTVIAIVSVIMITIVIVIISEWVYTTLGQNRQGRQEVCVWGGGGLCESGHIAKTEID